MIYEFDLYFHKFTNYHLIMHYGILLYRWCWLKISLNTKLKTWLHSYCRLLHNKIIIISLSSFFQLLEFGFCNKKIDGNNMKLKPTLTYHVSKHKLQLNPFQHSVQRYSSFLHSTLVHMNKRARTRLVWTFSYISCIFVHSDPDSSLFIEMQEKFIDIIIKYNFKK